MIIIIFLLIDQLIKQLVVSKMYLGQSIKIINNFFNITYVTNDGAAFNILSGNKIFLILVGLFVIIYILKNKDKLKEKYLYEILIAGILGNLIDRIFRGEVIDYLEFIIFGQNMAIFNFADTCIVLSCIILLILEVVKWKKSQLILKEKD